MNERDSDPCLQAVVVNGIRQDCYMGVWDNALDHADTLESILEEDDPGEVYAHGADWGARWLAAILGMGLAIGSRLCHECNNPNSHHMPWCSLL